MPPSPNRRDPWRKAPVGELQDQLLPRWFVLLCVIIVPVALIAIIVTFLVTRGGEIAVAQRRPPPAGEVTSDVGEYVTGATVPTPYEDACTALQGVQVGGGEPDRAPLRVALAALCNAGLPEETIEALSAFADQQGVVRFAQFQYTGVDSTAVIDAEPPVILINAKLQRTDPLWIAPLVVHDAVVLAGGDPSLAANELEARQAEAVACEKILATRRASRGCDDAEELLGLPDPLAELRGAGFE